MNKNSLLCKGIAVVVILLFIGLAFAPSIYANESEEELVEVTTEFCGLSGKRNTVQITQRQAKELDALFDEIKLKLDTIESREEAVDIFNEAIVELDKYGLLGGLSVKQAQRLVIGKYQNMRIMKLIGQTFTIDSGNSDGVTNTLCLIAGKSIGWPFAFESILSRLLINMRWSIFYNFQLFGIGVSFLSTLRLISIGNRIGFGGRYLVMEPHPEPYWEDFTSEGWIITFDLNGIKSWDGDLYGQLSGPSISFMYIGPYEYRPGVIGFTGIKISNIYSFNQLFLGSALHVDIGSEHPNT